MAAILAQVEKDKTRATMRAYEGQQIGVKFSPDERRSPISLRDATPDNMKYGATSNSYGASGDDE
jgi:hypothetical protein